MDRLSQLRGEAGGSKDSTLDTTSPPSEAYMTANENSSKYFSLSDSTFDITPIKDVSLASTSADADRSATDDDELISNLSPIGNKELIDSYKIGKQIEAANILSGGVDIFDDNENSFDGNELVIDDNVEVDDKLNDISEAVPVKEMGEAAPVESIAELNPPQDLPGPIDPEPELVDPEPELVDPELEVEQEENLASRDMEVILQIDGNNVNAINIGNGLYLYRRDGQEELAAIQIIDDNDPQHNFKFLKVRYNAEGNLEVYEEIEIEVPKEVPTKKEKAVDKNTSHVPNVESNKATGDSSNSKEERTHKPPPEEPVASTSKCGYREEKETSPESRTEVNLNGKKMKFSESRKSPVVGSFTPMTYHSTPNKEGKPLTKTMIDLQLHPNRHSDNVKKTIEVHTENVKQKSIEKEKSDVENIKLGSLEKEVLPDKGNTVAKNPEIKESNENKLSSDTNIEQNQSADEKNIENTKEKPKPSIVTNIAKDFTAEKCVLEHQKIDTKSNNSKQDPTGAESVANKEGFPINVKESDVVSSIAEKSALLQSITTKPAIISTVNNSVCIKKTDTSEKSSVEPNKAGTVHIDIDPLTSNKKNETSENNLVEPDKSVVVNTEVKTVPNSNKDIKPINNKIEVDSVEKDMPIAVKKVENISIDQIRELKCNSSETKEIKITSSNQKPVEDNGDSSIKSADDLMKFPLESFTDVSSTSMNIETEESKAESITLYAIDTDESVSLITPSSTTKIKEDITNLDNTISEVLVSDIVIENTAVNKQISKVPSLIIKESKLEVKNQVDTTTKTDPKSAEKLKVIEEKSNNQKGMNTEDTIARSIPGFSGKTTSVPVANITPSEKIVPAISISVVKPVKTKPSIPIPQVKASEKVTKPSDSITKLKSVPEVKSSDKGACSISMLGSKPFNKEIFPVTGVKASEKPGRCNTAPGAKASEKVPQSTIKPDAKPSEKMAHSTPKPNAIVKPSENAANFTEVKPKEMTPAENKTVKPDAHVPILTIAKPSSKLIPPVTILKNEGIKKVNDNPKEISKIIAVNKNKTQIKSESREINELIKRNSDKPAGNNHSAAVPFGKWTDVNRQEFLSKFKEVKTPINSNSKQIKNSNDLNRRDVLQKIDSQRAQTIINNATAKAQEKVNVKNEAVFSSKVVPSQVETKIPVKSENADKKPKQVIKQENPQKVVVTSTVPSNLSIVATVSKTEPPPRDLSTATMASLIDKTIEDMINRVVPSKNVVDEPIQMVKINASEPESAAEISVTSKEISKPDLEDSVSLDDIEMKMNELHGIPFVERPPHELPKIPKSEIKTYSKIEKVKILSKTSIAPNVASSTSELKAGKDNVIDIDSEEEEVIEHEPITGDLELNKKSIPVKLPVRDKKPLSEKSAGSLETKDASDKEPIITETDFDKFVRRNSISCENYLTVNFDHKDQQNVQTTKEKDHTSKVNPKLEPVRIDTKSKIPHKQTMRHNIQTAKSQSATRFGAVMGDSSNKKYQSKIHSAYQSALTAKHHVASPITIIEDKPVKVVFVESSTGFVPSQLNVQGKELSPAKKPVTELETALVASNDSVDSDIPETTEENKQQDKTKTKHQRKQVLTPVEAPELELIRPSDVNFETSPKKKRKIEDTKTEKQLKNLVHKKSYLLGRNATTEDKSANIQVSAKEISKDIDDRSEDVREHKDTASAIDNLVKAAELLENQSGTLNKTITPNPENQTITPVKRGRGRPRKYPLPENAAENKTPSPQKKPRLIDAKPVKQDSISEENDEDSSEEGIIRENWTMGKINENIVCPICNKLFRSENVVFKHVKHCTGVSPNRSESDKRSPRRSRLSQESEDLDMDDELPISECKNSTPKKRRSKDKAETKHEQTYLEVDKDDVIVIEDTPVKEKSEKHNIGKEDEPKKVAKAKIPHLANSLICEFCGKTFRQLSYLVSHKLQHKKEQTKEIEKDTQNTTKLQVFSCEICKKEFRKLHHLVQHRIIHNPDFVPKRSLRKSSSEQNGLKNAKNEIVTKPNEDSSAAFRCEPCDKSFRKLHHLVEHRETHDGINRQKPCAPMQPTVEKPPPQCDICKKTFRKLHHLIEHKEQHADTSSEKSDDKSVKSALSTKDIIHECSLCYMVFPNEHSLTKHTVICSKKKRQSKQPKETTAENESAKDENSSEDQKDEVEHSDAQIIVAEEIIDDNEKVEKEQDVIVVDVSPEVEKLVEVEKATFEEVKQTENEKATDSVVPEIPLQIEKEVKSTGLQSTPAKRDLSVLNDNQMSEESVVPEKIKKTDLKEVKPQDVPKKKTPLKDKIAPAVTKRLKTIDVPLSVADKEKPIESSDDEVRYMFNPNFKVDELNEGKLFMKVRASKRNSLQIERPSSKDLAKRRTSLQHPPKLLRVKPKPLTPKLRAVEPKSKAPENSKSLGPKPSSVLPTPKHIPKKSEVEATLSCDSDDSDVKYSFPKTAPETTKIAQRPKEVEKKVSRKSLTEKRKSLAGIAKRKSLGKTITTKHKLNTSPAKPIKKRTTEVEYRCDCGQLFSSAALLSRHTSLAHTPPRIRRRRSPPPDAAASKPLRHSTLPDQPSAPTRKSSVKSETTAAPRRSVATRKSSVKAEATVPTDTRKSVNPTNSEVKTAAKTRRSAAHTGVPVPEKMRKLTQKNK